MIDTLTDRIEAWEAGLDDFENPLLVIDKAFCAVAKAAPALLPCPQCSDNDMPADECGRPRPGDMLNQDCRIMPLRAALTALTDALGKE
jgi:hypothetical protein